VPPSGRHSVNSSPSAAAARAAPGSSPKIADQEADWLRNPGGTRLRPAGLVLEWGGDECGADDLGDVPGTGGVCWSRAQRWVSRANPRCP
jgi:hypothetical protein